MSSAGDSSSEEADKPRYARFARRLRGIFIDWMLALIFIFGALMIAAAMRNDGVSRILGVAVVASLVLYEPVLVSRAGGTIGHYLTNLRVVDEGHGGNVGFLKAVARVVIKGLLGWYSFIVMAATRRNQAIHDLLTRSTVQIGDPAKASSNQFVTDRVELAGPDMPSRARRIVIISSYLILAVIAFGGVVITIALTGGISAQCLETDACSQSERTVMDVLGLAFLATCAVCIVLGWKAKLFGARKA